MEHGKDAGVMIAEEFRGPFVFYRGSMVFLPGRDLLVFVGVVIRSTPAS